MDNSKWLSYKWENLNEYKQFEEEFVEEAKKCLGEAGYSVDLVLPNMWYCGMVVANENKTKWIHVTIPNVQETSDWYQHIKLRRMSSARDWKGDIFHFTTLEALIDDINKYMGDEYDDEIL